MSCVLGVLVSVLVMFVSVFVFARLFESSLLRVFIAWVLLIVVAETCFTDLAFKIGLVFGGPVILLILLFTFFVAILG